MKKYIYVRLYDTTIKKVVYARSLEEAWKQVGFGKGWYWWNTEEI